jgi:acetyl esterase
MTHGSWSPASNAYDPELAAALALIPVLTLDDLAAARTQQRELRATVASEIEGIEKLEILDHVVPSGAHGPALNVRSYVPFARKPPLPAVLYLHGGGFVLGSVDDDHAVAAAMALEVGAAVVSVEYRLAPEHRYPAGLEDCYAALCWIARMADALGIDLERIAVAGSSAGAALAAGVSLLSRDRHGPRLCFQLLNQPVLDDRLTTPSMSEFIDTPVWNRQSAARSWRYYLGESPGEVSYYAAPARADDLIGLPPTYLATAQFDPLRDEGITYAARLLQAGVTVELHVFPGTFHGSDEVETAEVSQHQIAELYDALRRGLRSSVDRSFGARISTTEASV